MDHSRSRQAGQINQAEAEAQRDSSSFFNGSLGWAAPQTFPNTQRKHCSSSTTTTMATRHMGLKFICSSWSMKALNLMEHYERVFRRTKDTSVCNRPEKRKTKIFQVSSLSFSLYALHIWQPLTDCQTDWRTVWWLTRQTAARRQTGLRASSDCTLWGNCQPWWCLWTWTGLGALCTHCTALIAVGKMANGQLSEPCPLYLPPPYSLRPHQRREGVQTSHN